MAKKKKAKRAKVTQLDGEDNRSVFWPLAGAILLIVLAAFLLLGGFGTGGPLPVKMFHGVYWTIGWAAYLTPLSLVFFGVHKFKSEDRRIPLSKLLSMVAFVVFAACYFQAMFVSRNNFGFQGGHGGQLGSSIAGAVLNALDKLPASILFFVLSVLMFFLAFDISPRVILGLFTVFVKNKEEDTDLAALKARAGDNGFQLNANVPLETHSGKEGRALRKVPVNDGGQALTAVRDPDWQLPGLDLLSQKQDKADAGDVEGNAEIIKETFANFNIDVNMEGANIGPRVTQYTLRPPTDVKLAKMVSLEDNIKLNLAAQTIRIEAPIPGKRAVGIEVPNLRGATVTIHSLLTSKQWKELNSPLGFVIGKDISGGPIVADLEVMPHLLVAGTTGSGKSMMINAIMTSLLYQNSPSDLKLIMVDPKRVELAPYNDIPHLLTPVITEPEKCISALKWAIAEMERRYRSLAEAHKRNIIEYNASKQDQGMPYIVIVIDELSDLMIMAARDVEALIVRIAQKARAVGIHLILATQRPSVDVITGLIKANVPARMAFRVISQVDSRTIIDQMGAEKLLGNGDMLFMMADSPKPRRVQGAFISSEETLKVTDFIRNQRPPQYDDDVISQPVQLNGRGGIVADYGGDGDGPDDHMWRDAVRVVIEARKASTSLLQRRLRIGYGRAARLIETMEEQGIISYADGNRPRDVLVSSMDEVFNRGGTGSAGDYSSADDEEAPADNE